MSPYEPDDLYGNVEELVASVVSGAEYDAYLIKDAAAQEWLVNRRTAPDAEAHEPVELEDLEPESNRDSDAWEDTP